MEVGGTARLGNSKQEITFGGVTVRVDHFQTMAEFSFFFLTLGVDYLWTNNLVNISGMPVKVP